MNIIFAFEKVKPYLTERIIQQVSEKLAAVGADCNEVNIEGFSLWHVRDAKNLENILKTRITTARDDGVRRCVIKKHEFVSKSLREITQNALWQGYVVTNGKHSSLLVNLVTGDVLCESMD